MRGIIIGVITFAIAMVISSGGLNYRTWQYWVTMALCCGLSVASSLLF
jgi:hypothetical protein